MSDRPLQLALFGDPVSHSLSPRIHGLFGEALGMAVEYQAVRCQPAELGQLLDRFASDGGTGANLTLPLKYLGMRACRSLDRLSRQARAVNTLRWQDGGWVGYNTDGLGLITDLERLGILVNDARVLVIGAGGASAGIIGPLLGARPAAVCILNRHADRAIELAERFEHLGPVRGGALAEGPGGPPWDLLLQATSLGHQGEIPPLDPRWLNAGASVYDLNYGAAHRPLAKWCAQHQLPCHDGLGMLVGQAALAFEIWTGRRPEIGPVVKALR